VEDDDDLRALLIKLLASEDYEVASASDGLEALAKLGSMASLPDLIILDWMMPRMDGAQFCIEKKKHPSIDAIPIILLTADGRVEEKMRQSQVSRGISKPVDIHHFLATVEESLAQGK